MAVNLPVSFKSEFLRGTLEVNLLLLEFKGIVIHFLQFRFSCNHCVHVLCLLSTWKITPPHRRLPCSFWHPNLSSDRPVHTRTSRTAQWFNLPASFESGLQSGHL